MRKFNFARPLLILAVAYLANSLTSLICILLGASKETSSNVAFLVMMIAVILTFTKLNKKKKKR